MFKKMQTMSVYCCCYVAILFIYLLSIFFKDWDHTKGISLYRVLPHKDYTQTYTIYIYKNENQTNKLAAKQNMHTSYEN